MKKFKIDAKFASDMVMGIIMIPFLLIGAIVISFALLIHFPYWKIKNRRKT